MASSSVWALPEVSDGAANWGTALGVACLQSSGEHTCRPHTVFVEIPGCMASFLLWSLVLWGLVQHSSWAPHLLQPTASLSPTALRHACSTVLTDGCEDREPCNTNLLMCCCTRLCCLRLSFGLTQLDDLGSEAGMPAAAKGNSGLNPE